MIFSILPLFKFAFMNTCVWKNPESTCIVQKYIVLFIENQGSRKTEGLKSYGGTFINLAEKAEEFEI